MTAAPWSSVHKGPTSPCAGVGSVGLPRRRLLRFEQKLPVEYLTYNSPPEVIFSIVYGLGSICSVFEMSGCPRLRATQRSVGPSHTSASRRAGSRGVQASRLRPHGPATCVWCEVVLVAVAEERVVVWCGNQLVPGQTAEGGGGA